MCLENWFGYLDRVLPVFNEEKIQEKIEGMLFWNAKKITLKVSASPTSDFWKKFQMSLGYEFIWKKAKPLRDSVLEFWSSWTSRSERDSIFAYLPSRRPYWQFVGNPETKKGEISVWERETKRKCYANKDC